MADIRIDLPDLKWRGLDPVPALCQATTWEHDQAERRYPYTDGAGHDNTGRGPIRMPVTLFFNSPMLPDPFGTWIKWRTALLDGTAGDLIHPIVGEIRAVVKSTTADTQPTARNNFQVDVLFEEHIDDPEEENDLNNQDLTITETAEAAESAAADFGVTWPDGSYSPSLTEAVAQIEGAAFSFGNDLASYVEKVAGTVDGMIQAIETVQDPLSHPALDGLLSTWGRLKSVAQRAERAVRSTASRQVTSDTTLDAFATSVKNTTAEIQGLNPSALRYPFVKKGSTLLYYV